MAASLSAPIRHLGDLAYSRARRGREERRGHEALVELEGRQLGLPDGLELKWLGVSGYRITYEAKTIFVDPYLSRLPLASLLRGASALPDERLLDRWASARGEVLGVLVGHTHFDHAVDAPAIARLRALASRTESPSPARAQRRSGRDPHDRSSPQQLRRSSRPL
jgi:glyoxylase-like metal-dependent hydrolase (beta-lactamase superfamily II)